MLETFGPYVRNIPGHRPKVSPKGISTLAWMKVSHANKSTFQNVRSNGKMQTTHCNNVFN